MADKYAEFRELLEYHNSNELAKMASLAGVSSVPTRKAQRIDEIVKVMTDQAEVKRLWNEMDKESQNVLAAAYHNGGVFNAEPFINQFGLEAMPERPGKTHYWNSGEWMILDLFLVKVNSYRKNIAGASIYSDVMPLLASLVPAYEPFKIEGLEELPSGIEYTTNRDKSETVPLTVLETEESGRRDLLIFLSLLNQGTIRFNSANTQLTAKGVEVLSNHLNMDDANTETRKLKETIRAFGLMTFAVGAKLVEWGKLTDLGKEYLISEDPALLLSAFLEWSESSDYDEVQRIDAIKGSRSKKATLTHPGERREKIMEGLSWLPVNQWISVVDFYRALKIWHLDFEIEEDGLDHLYVGYRRRTKYYAEAFADYADSWLLTNGLYINVLLMEYLATIGAVDIAYAEHEISLFPASAYEYYDAFYSAYDNLFYFRITPLGAFLFGQTGEYELPSSAVESLLQVNADGLIELLPDAGVTDVHRSQILTIADPVSDGQTDTPPRAYRLSKERMLLLIESGSELEMPLTFLQERGTDDLPKAVLDFVAAVKADSVAFHVSTKMVQVKVRSADLAVQVMEDSSVNRIARQLDGRTLLIPESRQTALRNALRSLGYGLKR